MWINVLARRTWPPPIPRTEIAVHALTSRAPVCENSYFQLNRVPASDVRIGLHTTIGLLGTGGVIHPHGIIAIHPFKGCVIFLCRVWTQPAISDWERSGKIYEAGLKDFRPNPAIKPPVNVLFGVPFMHASIPDNLRQQLDHFFPGAWESTASLCKMGLVSDGSRAHNEKKERERKLAKYHAQLKAHRKAHRKAGTSANANTGALARVKKA